MVMVLAMSFVHFAPWRSGGLIATFFMIASISRAAYRSHRARQLKTTCLCASYGAGFVRGEELTCSSTTQPTVRSRPTMDAIES